MGGVLRNREVRGITHRSNGETEKTAERERSRKEERENFKRGKRK